MKRIVTLFVLFLSTSLPQGSGLNIGPNYILYPSNVNQSEVFITKHPNNPDILFASANTIVFQPFFISEGVYTSTNGGNSWFGSDTCNGANISFHNGDPGIAIDKNGTFILSRLGRPPFYGIYSHYSTDNGRNWSSQNKITSDGESSYERAALSTDNNPVSPYFGRTYATWVKLSGTFPVEFSYTDDISQAWSQTRTINSFTQRSSGPDIETGLNGEIFICYALVSSTSPFNEIAMSFASSSDGGSSWNVNNNIFPVNGITGLLPQKSNIRVNGLPRIAVDKSNTSTRGTIYIVTTQKNLSPAGTDPDIILYKSSDNGQSWSSGIRVNQDALNNGKTQYFPAIDVDKYGGVNIIYYDDRSTTNDSSSVYLSRSTDGGISWVDYKISDHNFKPLPIGGLGQGYQGDNIDIVSVDDKLFPVWMDNSTGLYQIWSTIISIADSQDNLLPIIIEPVNLFDILPDEFKVSYLTVNSGDTKIKYGQTTNLELDSIYIAENTTFHQLTVRNLKPATTYFFQVFSKNYFGESKSQIYSVKTLARTDSSLDSKIKILPLYPNPTTGMIRLEIELSDKISLYDDPLKILIQLYNSLGNEIFQESLVINQNTKHKFEMNLSDYGLPSGIYFYKIIAGDFIDTKKFIYQK